MMYVVMPSAHACLFKPERGAEGLEDCPAAVAASVYIASIGKMGELQKVDYYLYIKQVKMKKKRGAGREPRKVQEKEKRRLALMISWKDHYGLVSCVKAIL